MCLVAAGSWSPWSKLWNVTLGSRQQHAASLSLHQGRQGSIYMFWFQKYFTSSEPEDAECLRDVWITPSISAESWWDMRSVTELRTQRLRICRISEFAEHQNCDTVAVPAQNQSGGCHSVRGQDIVRIVCSFMVAASLSLSQEEMMKLDIYMNRYTTMIFRTYNFTFWNETMMKLWNSANTTHVTSPLWHNQKFV